MLYGGIAMTAVMEGGMELEHAKRILRQCGVTLHLSDRGNGKRTLELSEYWPIEIFEALICSMPEPQMVQELLSRNSPRVAQRILLFHRLKGLECINLSDSSFYLEEANFETLIELPALQTLHVPNCDLRLTNLESLLSQSLRSLNLFGNKKLANDCLPLLAKNLPNLKVIVIGGTRISKSAVENVFGSKISVEFLE